MSIHFTQAKKGYKFKITFLGRRVKSVASKFTENSLYEHYKYRVPKSWLTNGYVEEVEDNGQNV